MTSSPGGSISSDTGRELFRGGGEGGGGVRLYRSLQKGAGSLNIKIVLLIKEKQISQVKELRAFLCMGGWKVWAYWNLSFHMHLNYLGPESCIFSNSPTPQLLGAHCQRGCAWWLLDSRLCFSWMPFSSVQFSRSVMSNSLWPHGHSTLGFSEIHIWRAGMAGGCDILIYWYGRKYSISQKRSSVPRARRSCGSLKMASMILRAQLVAQKACHSRSNKYYVLLSLES